MNAPGRVSRLLVSAARAVLHDVSDGDVATLLVAERFLALARQALDCRSARDWHALQVGLLTTSSAGSRTVSELRDRAYVLISAEAGT